MKTRKLSTVDKFDLATLDICTLVKKTKINEINNDINEYLIRIADKQRTKYYISGKDYNNPILIGDIKNAIKHYMDKIKTLKINLSYHSRKLKLCKDAQKKKLKNPSYNIDFSKLN